MTKERHYLAVDLGATSGRTILATFDGKKIRMKEVSRFANPMIPLGGHLYWDLPFLYNEVLRGLRKVASDGISIKSIGIDTWGCDFAFFGKDGRLLGLPHCYRDPHTAGAQEKFFSRLPQKEVYRRTGIQFMDFNSLFQLDTLKREGCEPLKHADKIHFIPDALTYMLTGESVCEYTVASTSQLLNPITGDLDEAILETLGIARKRFGRMVAPGTVVGKLSAQVQKETGIGAVDVIAVAGHDTGSAVAAVPAIDHEYAYLSCGTWSLLGIESPHPIINNVSFRNNFTNEGGIEGTTRFLKNICGLWIFEQCRKEFRNAPADVGELVASCRNSEYAGLIDPDDPSFANPASMTKAIDEFCRQTDQESPSTYSDYCRCIFRSLAMKYRQVTGLLECMASFPIKRLHVIGGGAQNKYLMQYAANALNRPVICGPVEGTALGNVLMQAKASGDISSLKQMREICACSTDVTTYLPINTEKWDQEYKRFLELCSLRQQSMNDN